MGLPVWCTDQAGPYQTIPYPGQSWQPEGEPVRLPHEYLRDGTAKVLTLFHPADGRVRLHGVTTCPNAVLHPWLKRELTDILAGLPAPPAEPAAGWRAAWERWQEGLMIKPTLLSELPPLRMLLVLDNLAGHKTPRAGLLAIRARDHAAVHAGGGLVAEHGREPAAHPQAARAGRAAPERDRPDHRLVRGGGAALGRGPDAVLLGRQAGGPSAAAARASPPGRRLGGDHPRPASPRVAAPLWLRPTQMTH
jgi:hypothetical protein